MEINRASLPAADRLDEIVNGAKSLTYFTKRSAVYFYPISIVFLIRASLFLITQPSKAPRFSNCRCAWYSEGDSPVSFLKLR